MTRRLTRYPLAESQVAERRAIRHELAALAARARAADLLSIALILDLAMAVEFADGAPWDGPLS